MALKRVAQFTSKDLDLDRRLVEFQKNVEEAIRLLEQGKRPRYTFRESAAATVQMAFGECLVLDTTVRAIDAFLPQLTPNDAGSRCALVRISAAFAVTVRAFDGVTIGAAATHAPSTGVVTEYETNGREWWVA